MGIAAGSVRLVALLAAVLACRAAGAVTYLRPTPAPGDEFGRSVAVIGSNVLVGADLVDQQTPENGLVYLFDGNTGALLQTFLDPAPIGPVWPGFSEFGHGVGAFGNDALVGKPGLDLSFTLQNVGEVYRFDTTTASIVQTYVNPTPSFQDNFGQVIATVGPYVVVGAQGDDTYGYFAGAVYVFDGATAALVSTLYEPVPVPGNSFGFSVAGVGGTKVLVGVPNDDATGADAGAAYLYDAATGALLQTFHRPTPQAGAYFGWSVAGYGNDVVIGAIADNAAAIGGGAVYRMDATTGALLQTYLYPGAQNNDLLGHSLTVVGTAIAAGAIYDSTACSFCGAVHVFDAATGALLHTCLAGTPGYPSDYGYSVATLGGDVVVGARLDSLGAPWAGAAYRCSLTPPPVCGNGIVEAGEACDDGNTVGNDGCSATCTLECGDGILEGTEQCDDGNTLPGDGCDATCQFEPNFLDHYLCYQIKPTSPFGQIPLSLVDQFESAHATVKKPVALCPPANKNGEGIKDAVTHEEMYLIKQTSPVHQPRTVTTRDQFGELSLDARTVQTLMVPTNKGLGVVPPDPAPGVQDHYKCYRVRVTPNTPPFVPVTVTAADQFQSRTYTVRKPVHLCNPVDKNGEGIEKPSGHLVCYAIVTDVKHKKVVNLIHTANQFGHETMDTVKPVELCVPALKREK